MRALEAKKSKVAAETTAAAVESTTTTDAAVREGETATTGN